MQNSLSYISSNSHLTNIATLLSLTVDHDINKPWKFDTIYKHANYLLSGAKWNLPQPDSSALFPQNSAPSSSPAVPTILKREYVHVAQQPVSTPPPNKLKKDNSVIPLIHSVSSAEEQMGTELQTAGHNFKEKINNFLAMHDSIIASANLVSVQRPSQQSTSSCRHETPPHLISTMFFSNEVVLEYQVDLHPSSYLVDENLEEDANEEDQRALARAYAQVEELKNAIKKKKTARFDGVEVPVRRQRPALAVPASANVPVPPIPVSNSAPANPASSSEAPTAGKTPVAPNL
ncbi:hypothetical protein M404DRAFT_32495 [Pisolithus tinctorius Marx 270]|uniref:Uncharacterized protein n=1 Tax=Pisolithus tinctorius Marx 270 TaxID=870435 RepID=A0A0C3NNT8_PISTI|nr:hypothetical protein M404DRAFT_32495 [Pisolithus tinctorius Marx 270]